MALEQAIDIILRSKMDTATQRATIMQLTEIEKHLDDLEKKKAGGFTSALATGVSKAAGAMKSLGGDVLHVAKSLDEAAGKAAKFALQLGAAAIAGGVGVTFASASAYAQRNPGERGAAEMTKAQEDVAKAFADLGRVTARVATPALETLADTIEITAKALDQLIPKQSQNVFEKFITDTLPQAMQSASRLVGIVEGVFGIVKSKFEDAIDSWATGFRVNILALRQGIGQFINGLFETVANVAERLGLKDIAGALRGSKDQNAVTGLTFAGRGKDMGGRSIYEQQAFNEQGALDERRKQREAALSALGDALGQRDSQVNGIGTAIRAAFSAARGERGAGTGGFGADLGGRSGPGGPVAGLDAWLERVRAINDMNRASAQERLNIEKSYNEANAKAEKQAKDAEAKLNADYMDSERKAAADYFKQEQRETTQANKERLRTLQDLQDDLNGLAARRDVAGFIERQRQGQKDLERQKQDMDEASAQRAQDYLDQRKEAATQHEKQLTDLHKSLEDQKRENKQAHDTALQMLRDKNYVELQMINQHFAQALANTANSYGGLNDLNNQFLAQQTAAFTAYVDQNKAKMAELLGQSYGSTAPTSASYAVSSGSTGSSTASRLSPTARTNITVNQTVGDVVTQRQLARVQQQTVQAVADAYMAARSN